MNIKKCLLPAPKIPNFLKLPQTKNGKLYFSPIFQKGELRNSTFFQSLYSCPNAWLDFSITIPTYPSNQPCFLCPRFDFDVIIFCFCVDEISELLLINLTHPFKALSLNFFLFILFHFIVIWLTRFVFWQGRI